MGVGGRKSKLTPRKVQSLLGDTIKTFPYEASKENTDVEPSNRELEHHVLDMEVGIARERLRQARYGFQLSLIMTTVSTIISLAGVVLLLGGSYNTTWALGAGAGLSSIAVSLRFSKEANDELDELANEIKSSEPEE